MIIFVEFSPFSVKAIHESHQLIMIITITFLITNFPSQRSLILTKPFHSGKASPKAGPKLQFSSFFRCVSKTGLMLYTGSSTLEPVGLPTTDDTATTGGLGTNTSAGSYGQFRFRVVV